jgi:hypothetical protein
MLALHEDCMRDLPYEAVKFLSDLGWGRPRCVDIAEIEHVLLTRGFVISNAAREVLRSFDGYNLLLRLVGPKKELRLEFAGKVSAQLCDVEHAREVAAYLNTSLTPVGFVDGELFLMVCEDERVIAALGDVVVVLGSDLSDMFQRVMDGEDFDTHYIS